MKKFITGVVLVGAATAAVAFTVMKRPTVVLTDIESVPLATVERGGFEVSLTSIGELRASRSTVLSSPYGGKIIKLLPEGARVEAGDPVIWFETEEHEQSLQEEESQLALDMKDLQSAEEAFELEKLKNDFTLESERIKVEIARQKYEDAKQNHESEETLFEKNISPQTKLDEARLRMLQEELNLRNAQINLAKVEENLASNLRVKEREIEKARLRVERRQIEVDEERERLEKATVFSTTPGDISYLKTWKSGSVSKIAEGDTVWRTTALVEIPDPTVMLAVVPVNEIDISRIEEGQRAEVTVDAIPERVFPAVVEGRSIVPISDPSRKSWESSEGSGPREFEVRVRLEQKDELFRQGMTASARIILEETESTLHVPLEAVTKRGGEQGVYVKRNGVADFIPVSVPMTNENFAAVDGKLSDGDRVLLRDPFRDDEAGRETPVMAETGEIEPKENTAGAGDDA